MYYVQRANSVSPLTNSHYSVCEILLLGILLTHGIPLLNTDEYTILCKV